MSRLPCGHAGEEITREDQELCATCHQDMHGAGYAKSELRAATDFLENHPSFKVAVNKFRAKGVGPWCVGTSRRGCR